MSTQAFPSLVRPTDHDGERSSRTAIRVGRVLSGLAIAFLTFDAVGKLLLLPPVAEGSAELGFESSTVFVLGVVLLSCVVLYAVPATSIAGAVLLTGYLGGAIATHARVGNPLVSHTLFPIYVALFVWGGTFLREPRLRALFPFRRDA